MVGHRSGEGGRALHHVEPVHDGPVVTHLAPARELADETQARGPAAHEVGFQAQDRVGLVETVLRLHGLAESQDRARAGLVAPRGLVVVPLRGRELGQHRRELGGQGGGGDGAGEEPEAGPLLALLLREGLAQRGPELDPGPHLAVELDGLRPVRVVEAEDVGLPEHVGGPPAHGMIGVPLDLGGPALVALHQHPPRVAVVGHRGREEERPPRHQLLRLLDVGEDLLRGLAGAGGEAGQGERGAHEGEELAAALGVLEGRGLLGELAVEELEEARAVQELLQALPVAAAGRPLEAPPHSRELHGDAGDLVRAHRWQVEQVTWGRTSYLFTSSFPSAS